MAFNIGINITANNKTNAPLKQAEKNVDKIGKTAKRATSSIKGFRLALGLLAVGTLVRVSKGLVQVIGDMQQMFIRLTAVEGGAKKARVTFDRLFKTFGSTPFSIDAVTDSFTRLRAAGIESEVAFRSIQFGADAIAAFGGTSEELKRFSIGLQQVAGKGVLSMEELRQQIGEALPVAMRVFATESGKSISQVIAAVEKGEIASLDFITTLNSGLEKEFGGFAQSLGSTVLGSIQGAFSKAKKALFEFSDANTDVTARLAATFQNIGTATADWIKTLNQDDVDKFFSLLVQGVDVVKVMVEALRILANGVIWLSQKISNINKDWNEFFTVIKTGFAGFGELFSTADDPTPKFLTDEQVAKTIRDTSDAAKGAANSMTLFGKEIIGTKEQADAIQESLDKVKNRTDKSRFAIEGLGKVATRSREQLRDMDKALKAGSAAASTFPFIKTAETGLNRINKLLGTLKSSRKKLADLKAKPILSERDVANIKALSSEIADFEGLAASARKEIQKTRDIALSKEVAKVNARTGEVLEKYRKLTQGTDEWKNKIDAVNAKFKDIGADIAKQIQLEKALLAAGAADLGQLDRLLAAQKSINAENLKAVDLIREQKELRSQTLAIQMKLNDAQTKAQVTQLNRQARGGLAILTSSERGDEVEDRRNELNISILQTKKQIAQINEKLKKATGDQAKFLENQKANLEKVAAAQNNALAATTEAGLLARDLWLGVRDAMDSVLNDGIKGLIKGTTTFAEVTQAAFDKITDAAIDYLIELVKIQLRTAAINALNSQNSSGGGGGGGGGDGSSALFKTIGGLAASFFGGSANGNAFKGKVKPFADGGIIRGPTMFGLAGEAGTEAIMPLTRVGGKLGVKSDGSGGGDNFNITIQAIDQKSGAEFLRSNSDQIARAMQSQRNLNRGR